MQATLTLPGAARGAHAARQENSGDVARRAATTRSASLHVLIPSISAVVFIGCLALTVVFGSLLVSGDGDAARHLVVGDYILRTGSIPSTNLFVGSTPTQPFLAHEWLAEVAGALLFRLLGLAAPVLLHGAAIGGAFALLYTHLRARGAPLLLALAVTQVVALTSQIHWHVRPHVFTWLGLVAFAYVLDGWRSGRLRRRALLWLPPLMAPWANLHGGFAVGLALVAAHAAADTARAVLLAGAPGAEAARRLRLLAPVAALCVAAACVNPAGPSLLLHLREYLTSAVILSQTQEFMAPDFSNPVALLFLVLLLSTVVVLPWSGRRPAFHEALVMAALAFVAMKSARHIPLFAIAAAPVLADALRRLELPDLAPGLPARVAQAAWDWTCRRNAAYTRMDARGHATAWPAIALAALGAVALLQVRAGEAPLGVRFAPHLQPVAAAAYLREQGISGQGFNAQHWGGYLLHALGPEAKVFIDGELNTHSEVLVRDYVAVVQADDGWAMTLDRYGVSWVLVPPDAAVAGALRHTGAWEQVFADPTAVLLVRRTAIT